MAALFLFAIATANAGVLGPWLDNEPSAGGLDTGTPEIAYADPPVCGSYNSKVSVALPESNDTLLVADPTRAHGSPYLVDLLTYTGETMAILRPEADRILIGDLSTRGGGPLPPHITHRQGVDADIGLYAKGGVQPIQTGFRRLTSETLDYEANWQLIQTLLGTGRVDFILLDQKLIDAMRTWLLENDVATRSEVDNIFPPAGTPRIWEMDGVVIHAPRHDNHLHVEVRCAAAE